MAFITSSNPDFDLSQALRQRVLQEARDWDIFGTSPLTSVASSPLSSLPPSPSSSPLLLPISFDEASSLEPGPFHDPVDPGPSEILLQDLSSPPSHPLTPLNSVTPAPTKKDRRAKRKASHTHARRRRRVEAAEASFGQYQVRDRALQRYVRHAPTISTPMDIEGLSVDSKGFIGIDKIRRSKKIYRLEELVGEGSKGFRLIHWDGMYVSEIPCMKFLLTYTQIAHLYHRLKESSCRHFGWHSQRQRLGSDASRGCRCT